MMGGTRANLAVAFEPSFSAAVAAQSFVQHTANKSNTLSERRKHTDFLLSCFPRHSRALAPIETRYTRTYMGVIQRQPREDGTVFTHVHSVTVYVRVWIHVIVRSNPYVLTSNYQKHFAPRVIGSRYWLQPRCNRLRFDDINVNFNGRKCLAIRLTIK